jgi:hypothetical protein
MNNFQIEHLIQKYLLRFPVDHESMSYDPRSQYVTFELHTDDGIERTQISLEEIKLRLAAAAAQAA